MRRILREREVAQLNHRSRVSSWRDERAGRFPLRVRIGPNAVGWFADDIKPGLRPALAAPAHPIGQLEEECRGETASALRMLGPHRSPYRSQRQRTGTRIERPARGRRCGVLAVRRRIRSAHPGGYQDEDAELANRMGFTLNRLALPWQDDDNNPETSVVLVPTGVPVEAKGSRRDQPSRNERLALDALRSAIETSGTAPVWASDADPPSPIRVTPVQEWRQAFYDRTHRQPGRQEEGIRPGTQAPRRDRGRVGTRRRLLARALGNGAHTWDPPDPAALNQRRGAKCRLFGAATGPACSHRDRGQDGTFRRFVPVADTGCRDRRDTPLLGCPACPTRDAAAPNAPYARNFYRNPGRPCELHP